MSLTIIEPVRLVKELKGAPLAILVLLSLTSVPVSREWLVAHAGYSDKPVSKALTYLQEHGFIYKTTGSWQVSDGCRQLPLLLGPALPAQEAAMSRSPLGLGPGGQADAPTDIPTWHPCDSTSHPSGEIRSFSDSPSPTSSEIRSFSDSPSPASGEIRNFSDSPSPVSSEIRSFSDSPSPVSSEIRNFSDSLSPASSEIRSFSDSPSPASSEIRSFSDSTSHPSGEIRSFSDSPSPTSGEIRSFSDSPYPASGEIRNFSDSPSPASSEIRSFSDSPSPVSSEIRSFSDSPSPASTEIRSFSEINRNFSESPLTSSSVNNFNLKESTTTTNNFQNRKNSDWQLSLEDKLVACCLAEHGISLNARTRLLLGAISCDDILSVAQELAQQKKVGETGLFVFRLEQRVAMGMGSWQAVYGPPDSTPEVLEPLGVEDPCPDDLCEPIPEFVGPPEVEAAWRQALRCVQDEIPKVHSQTWLSSACLLAYDPDPPVLIVGVLNTYGRDWLAAHTTGLFEQSLAELLAHPLQVRFCCHWELAAETQALAVEEQVLAAETQALAAEEQVLAAETQAPAAEEQVLAAETQALAVKRQAPEAAVWEGWQAGEALLSSAVLLPGEPGPASGLPPPHKPSRR